MFLFLVACTLELLLYCSPGGLVLPDRDIVYMLIFPFAFCPLTFLSPQLTSEPHAFISSLTKVKSSTVIIIPTNSLVPSLVNVLQQIGT